MLTKQNNTLAREKIRRILSDFLSIKEIKLYLTALQSGPISVQELAKRAGIDRVNCYQIINSLAKKGLIVQELKKFGRNIIAENPKKILKIIDNQKRKLRHRELDIKDLMPELLALYQIEGIRPKIKVYEGQEGYFAICEDTLRSGEKNILQIGNLKNLYNVISKDYDDKHYIPARMKNQISAQILTFKSPLTEKFKRHDSKFLRETRFLSDKFIFKGYKYIYKNKVAIISSAKELIGLVIESQDLTHMERQIFEILWQKQNK